MRFRQIEDQRDNWPVRVMCDALSVSPSGYYAWRSRPESPRKSANRALLNDIQRVHARHRERHGAPRIHAELRAEGQTVSRKRIERMMRHHGIRARAARRYRVCTTDSKHSLPVAPNLLDQNFVADRSNQVWLADITYIPTAEGWLYLAVILDLFTRKVVGWAMRDHMRAELTIAALTMAIQRRRPRADLIHHSDRGSQYAAGDYRDILRAAGITQSPKGKLLGQRAYGELLRHAEDRTRPSTRISRSGCRSARPVCLHRRLLQSSVDPLRHRLHHPRSGRGNVRLTRCPLFRGKLSQLDDVGGQPCFIVSALRRLALCRAMLAQGGTGASLGNRQHLMNMLDAGTATRGA
jgi:putative transposase